MATSLSFRRLPYKLVLTALMSLAASDAGFGGASADGTKFFFTTDEQLATSDTDSFSDLYERSAGTTTLVSVEGKPPNTSITKLTVNSAKHKATLRFNGTDPAPSSLPLDFKCKIDKKNFTSCSSPKTYKHLKVGKHRFRVKARDAAGNLDLTPALKRFRIKP